MFEAERDQLTVQEALDWYVGEYLVGKRRDRTIEEYRRDLEEIFAAIPIKYVTDLSLSYLDHYVATHTSLLSPATLRRRFLQCHSVRSPKSIYASASGHADCRASISQKVAVPLGPARDLWHMHSRTLGSGGGS
jgi:hypothetical protein